MADNQAPSSKLRSLEKLLGVWRVSGGIVGTVRYEWLEGGFFLVQHFDFEHRGHQVSGIEIIGHLQPFGQTPSQDLHARIYDNMGNTFDYVYELEDNKLTIWGGSRGSSSYYQGIFGDDGETCNGQWVFAGGGGYASTMTRISKK